MKDATESAIVYTRQERIAELARQEPKFRMVSLNKNLDDVWLREAHRLTRKDGATGVDGQTGADYAVGLQERLDDLLERAKSGSYFAQPVRRAYIPKDDGKMRPLGVTAFECKILQRAVVMLLEPVYEADFYDCSYGYRPNRSAHGALKTIWKKSMDMGGCWLIDADIKGFFDNVGHAELKKMLNQRVGDGVICRLVSKWLHAGVWEMGQVTYPEAGTPQGGVISPLLSNIYLHEVLDKWFHETVMPLMDGKAFMVRFADDFVMGFAEKRDAERVLAVLGKRLAKFGLELHPTKTRLVNFRPGGDSFDFLGFTHTWRTSRKGNPYVCRETSKGRFTRSLDRMKDYLKKSLALPIPTVMAGVKRRLVGHFNYFGRGNSTNPLQRFRHETERALIKSLRRRSGHHARKWTWDKFSQLLKRYPLPTPSLWIGT
jgi:group II intron reverse transcriptase/maturase